MSGADYSRYPDLARDIANWKTISQVQQGQKIQITNGDLNGKGEVMISVGAKESSLGNMSRSISKVFGNTMRDAAKTAAWVEAFEYKTLYDIDTLVANVRGLDGGSADRLEALEMLVELRKNIAAAQTGFEHLQATYQGRGEVVDALVNHQSFSTKLLAKIDTIIQEQSSSIERSAEQKEDVIGIIQGKQSVSVERTEMRVGDKVAEVPMEVKKELSRLSFSYNQQLLTEPSKQRTIEAYNELSESVGSRNVADVLLLLCGQANITYVSDKVNEAALESLGPVSFLGKSLHCFIDVKQDVTVVTLNTRVHFEDMDDPEAHIVKGYADISREITIPNAALEKLKDMEYSKIKEMKDPLPGMAVLDSYKLFSLHKE